jgi:uncharacterized 2Fe-2S/4Fe-4S cluster protein (DUF4445 family)
LKAPEKMPQLALELNSKSLAFDFVAGDCVLQTLKKAEVKIGSACAGQGFCGLCRIKVLSGNTGKLSHIERNKLSLQQIQQGTRLACQLKPISDLSISIENPHNVLKWRVAHHLNKTALCATDHYGIAFDLGTTHLRLSLWNSSRQQRIISWQTFNPQFCFGADVLTRLLAAKDSESDALELGLLVKQSLKKVMLSIAKLPLEIAQIQQLLIVGNSAMLVLVSQKNYQQLLDPEYWAKAIDCQIEEVTAWQSFLGLNSNTLIATVPSLAGFIGSDLLAGILATGLTNTNESALFIDFGTNSEMALWDGKKLWVSSVPGGPAFEGCGISCGMAAEADAICSMSLQADNQWNYQVIGQGAGLGLCGSGLVDVIAQLLAGNQLNRNGRFKNLVNNEYVLTLTSGQILAIKKQDIDIFQRAKAATGAAIVQLLTESKIALPDLSRICVSGAFGQFLNTANAQAIGLLPQIALEKIELYENTALTGCELLLSAPQNALRLDRIRAYAKVINMACVFNFDECFVENLYLQPIFHEL